MKRSAVLVIAFVTAMFVWMGYNALAVSWTPPLVEVPTSPLRMDNSSAYGSWDRQLHNRDDPENLDAPMMAEHGIDCSGPPNAHLISKVEDGAYACNGHWMTAANAHGYGEVVLTPAALLDCSLACTLDFDLSTKKMSARDWWVVELTPWADNLTLPFDDVNPDLQGPPRNSIAIDTRFFPVSAIITANGADVYHKDSCCVKPEIGRAHV